MGLCLSRDGLQRIASSNTEAMVWACTQWNHNTTLRKIAAYTLLSIAVSAAAALDTLVTALHLAIACGALAIRHIVFIATCSASLFYPMAKNAEPFIWATNSYVAKQARTTAILATFMIIAPVAMLLAPKTTEKWLIQAKVIEDKAIYKTLPWSKIVMCICGATAAIIAAKAAVDAGTKAVDLSTKTLNHPGLWGTPLEQLCLVPVKGKNPLTFGLSCEELYKRCSLLYFPLENAANNKLRQIKNAYLQIFQPYNTSYYCDLEKETHRAYRKASRAFDGPWPLQPQSATE